jgi:microcystin-dependent protein
VHRVDGRISVAELTLEFSRREQIAMSTPFLGEIRLFAGNFAPRGNATCSGQTLAISQNTALFALLGTIYGGNGVSTFQLPDLRGRLPVHMGQGQGLSSYTIGETLGEENHTLTVSEMPQHTHVPMATSSAANSSTPAGMLPAALQAPWLRYWVQNANKSGSFPLSPTAMKATGNSQPHSNIMPIAAITCIVALQGIFPSRN